MRNEPIKVLCVDDNDLLAEALEMHIKRADGLSWVGRLPSANNLTTRALHDHPDVVLMDIDMPGKDPFEAIEELAEACPDVRVLMLSGLVRSELIERAIEAGAWGYLSKNDGMALVSAIERVMDGEFIMGPEAQAQYLRQ